MFILNIIVCCSKVSECVISVLILPILLVSLPNHRKWLIEYIMIKQLLSCLRLSMFLNDKFVMHKFQFCLCLVTIVTPSEFSYCAAITCNVNILSVNGIPT